MLEEGHLSVLKHGTETFNFTGISRTFMRSPNAGAIPCRNTLHKKIDTGL